MILKFSKTGHGKICLQVFSKTVKYKDYSFLVYLYFSTGCESASIQHGTDKFERTRPSSSGEMCLPSGDQGCASYTVQCKVRYLRSTSGLSHCFVFVAWWCKTRLSTVTEIKQYSWLPPVFAGSHS